MSNPAPSSNPPCPHCGGGTKEIPLFTGSTWVCTNRGPTRQEKTCDDCPVTAKERAARRAHADTQPKDSFEEAFKRLGELYGKMKPQFTMQRRLTMPPLAPQVKDPGPFRDPHQLWPKPGSKLEGLFAYIDQNYSAEDARYLKLQVGQEYVERQQGVRYSPAQAPYTYLVYYQKVRR